MPVHARRGGSGARQPDRRHPVARLQPQVRATFARSSPRRRRASTAFRCCPTPPKRSASRKATACAPCRLRRPTDERRSAVQDAIPPLGAAQQLRRKRWGPDELRRPARPDAQLLGPRARQPRRRAQCAAGRESARSGAAGPREDARARRARISRRPCCRRTSGRTCDALRALGFAGSDHDVIVARRARRAGAAGRLLVRRGDVGCECRDRQRRGRLRGRPHAFHAGESRHAFPSRARSADDDARAARDLRRRQRAFACTIRCRLRRSSATKARPTTRASPRMRRGPASTSSSTADVGSAAAPRQPDIRRGRRAKRARRSRAGTASIPMRTRLRAAARRRDRRRRVPQRRDRGRRRNVPVLPRARVRRPGGGAGRACSKRSARAFRRDRRPRRRVAARRRRRHLPVQQPAAAAASTARFLLVAPAECRAHRATSQLLDRLIVDRTPIAEVLTFDLRQSMRNGGGPACLRLRVPLTRARPGSGAGERVLRCGARCGARRVDSPPLPRPARANGSARSRVARRIAARARRADAIAAAAVGVPVSAGALTAGASFGAFRGINLRTGLFA